MNPARRHPRHFVGRWPGGSSSKIERAAFVYTTDADRLPYASASEMPAESADISPMKSKTKSLTPRRTANVSSGDSPSVVPARLKRILVPLDLSGTSRRALRYAVPLAEKFGGEIFLLHVLLLRLTSPDFAFVEVDEQPVKREADAKLKEIQRTIWPSSLCPRTIIDTGHAAEQIVAVADRIAADVIVMTTHGYSGVKRFLMGSTAEQVLRHAECPVFLVRRT
jgi:universal stress protein A